MGRLVRSGGCVTSKAFALPSRDVIGCQLHPSDLLLLCSVAAEVGNRVEGESAHS